MTSTGTGSSASAEPGTETTTRPALIFAAIDLPEPYWPELHDWYETEHIPERRAAGLGPITRWERRSGDLPRFLALCEASTLAVLTTGPYARLKMAGDTPWTARLKKVFDVLDRGLFVEVASFGQGRAGPCCAVALTAVPAPAAQAYDQWYDTEHGPAVAGVPGVLRMRRFVSAEDPGRHLSIVDLTSPDVLTGAAYGRAKATHPGDELRAVWQRRQAVYARWTGDGSATTGDGSATTGGRRA